MRHDLRTSLAECAINGKAHGQRLYNAFARPQNLAAVALLGSRVSELPDVQLVTATMADEDVARFAARPGLQPSHGLCCLLPREQTSRDPVLVKQAGSRSGCR
ncbi:hypothetical protein HRR77_002983 [Exophiala dermatitidis]|uniref:Uncharacterized protein n=1 Tax=Exophiala dermatitidis (strain ATCC 34100 / CBS 525.76 / NIH/UT8656) TaxID=858893 RepID=H6C0X1_EXODN|nr:uncharacterized protein HMPREF1120_05351 [Exophiala dermatitidis NIH/UT8656]EHY57309.1 hypothetical protein HMPREF1120_05351 [Exophiala dermatitidis NIH/UT8656]KAJ4551756.1 hypothetical protein HRR77_002983 [Exophiala dermatitidis]